MFNTLVIMKRQLKPQGGVTAQVIEQKDAEKLDPSGPIGRNPKWRSHFYNVYQFLKK